MAFARNAVSEKELDDFLSSHRLPHSFVEVSNRYYLPLAKRLPDMRTAAGPLLLGINGAQGTGKSTLADFLRLAASSLFEWTVAVLSIDDFYFTLAEREALAQDVHPLLRTRGVPGTHDTQMLAACLDRLAALGEEESIALPRFDKATDDRADKSTWPRVSGPVDMVILEGWCVGTIAQNDADLAAPMNDLEREQDIDGRWRQCVNDRLASRYAPIFSRLDALVFLEAPGFDAIFRWRLEQEQKLAAASAAGAPGIMSRDAIRTFISYYERLTRANLASLPGIADVVYELDEHHNVVSGTYR